MDYTTLCEDIRRITNTPHDFIPLHAPVFRGKEREYVLDAIDSTYVSSVGAYVDRFEAMLRDICGVRYAIACVNGTAALEVALRLAGVEQGDLVLTQSLSFVATANAISHCGAIPIFLDIDADTLGLSPAAVQDFLHTSCDKTAQGWRHSASGKRVAACVPMHTLGFPCRIHTLQELCAAEHIPLVEDAAEALGSVTHGQHCGSVGLMGTLSFNGNKIVTTGGGGAILTNDAKLGVLAKHITTTAKVPHGWEFRHDAVAWNYRMPNLNAALGCAQLEQLSYFLGIKRERAAAYKTYFANTPWIFVEEPPHCRSNYWLCGVLAKDRTERDAFLAASNTAGVMTRPFWELLHTLPIYAHAPCGDVTVCRKMADRLVNLPSGV